jgi:hypothetical protein
MKKLFICIGFGFTAIAALAATQAKPSLDKPWKVYRVGAYQSRQDAIDTKQHFYFRRPDGTVEKHGRLRIQQTIFSAYGWLDSFGGGGSQSDTYYKESWDKDGNYYLDLDTAMDWSFLFGADGKGAGDAIYSFFGSAILTSQNNVNIWNYSADEHCQVKDGYPPPQAWNNPQLNSPLSDLWESGQGKESYARMAQTIWHVQTGGRAVPGRQNLWRFSGSAAAVIDVRAVPPFASRVLRAITDKTQIALGSLGNLKADGTLWLTLPDDVERDVTPYVAGNDFYTFGVGGQKYTLSITANGSDLATTTPEFCVGQKVTFNLNGLPGGIIDKIGGWNLPLKYVNHQWQQSTPAIPNQGPPTSYGSVNYDIDSSLLRDTSQTACWFVNGQGGSVSVGLSLKFPNGQAIPVTANGDFMVYRPQVTFPFTVNQTIIPMFTNGWLQLGNSDKYGGDNVGIADFDCKVTSKPPFAGVGNWTQLLKRSVNLLNKGDTDGRYDLDTSRFYNNNHAPIWQHTGIAPSPNPWGKVALNDSPGTPIILKVGGIVVWTFDNVTIKDDVNTYLEFKPDGDSIWVTLGIVTWGWGATKSGSIMNSPSTVQPQYQDSDQFPVWIH